MNIKTLIIFSIFISGFILGCNSEESINNPLEKNIDSLEVEGVNNTIFPLQMDIEYVRVYEKVE